MKILVVLSYYYPHWTGLTQYAIRLAEGFVKRGHKVEVLTSRHNRSLPRRETINGVHVRRMNVWFRISRAVICPLLPIVSIVRIFYSDRVIVYLPYPEVVWITFLARIFNKPCYVIHNGDLVLPSGIINRLIEWLYRIQTQTAFFLCTSIVIQTIDYASHSSVLSPWKVKWVCILPLYPPVHPSKQTIRRIQQFLPRHSYIVGFAGRFVREKGFDILLSAIPLVVKKIPTIQFVYAGEIHMAYERFADSQKKRIYRCASHLKFLGKLTNEEMAVFYQRINLMVVPSRTDCFPSVEIEALLSGVPVIVSDIPGARWAVLQTKMGSIVPPEDVNALANAIIRHCTMPKSRTKHDLVVKTLFSYQRTLDQYEKLLLRPMD